MVFAGALLGGALIMVPSQKFSFTSISDVVVKEIVEQKEQASHMPTPSAVKAAYMSACAASSQTFRTHFTELFADTELNAVIIDVKDFSGTIAFPVQSELLRQDDATGCFVKDMKELVQSFHDAGVYTIARITVFQDPYYAPRHLEQAVQKESDKSLWKDGKGLSFVDVGARPFWEYITEIGNEAYAIGFDELNFDYVRYPSDGNMKDIYYPVTETFVQADSKYGKAKELKKFFAYLDANLDERAKTSADLFGMTTTNIDDLNIGQIMEYALPYFDYIAPMTYPSHYPKGFYGISNPNEQVYNVMKISLDAAVQRLIAPTTLVYLEGVTARASTTPAQYPKESQDIQQIRPWIQDFDYGGNYGPVEVRAQIQAVYDSGLTSWMLWDPSNKYTKDALLAN